MSTHAKIPSTGRRASAVKRRRSFRRRVGPAATTFIVRGNEVTHAVIPVAEYERLISERKAIEETAVLDDRDGPWIPLEDAVAQVAAHDIVKARKKAGLTQAQLATKVKMPQSQISRIESNPDRTTVRTLKKIAKALGVDVRYLL